MPYVRSVENPVSSTFQTYLEPDRFFTTVTAIIPVSQVMSPLTQMTETAP